MRISDWSSDVCSSDLDIQLDKPNLTGSVLSPGDGVALGGVRVVLTTAADDSVPGGEVTTSGDGTFGFAVAPGAYKLTAHPSATDNPRSLVLEAAEVVVGAEQIGRASCRERVCQYV